MEHLKRITDYIIDRRRLVLGVVLLTLLTVSGGVVSLEQESAMPAFTVGSEEESALEYVESNFSSSHDDVTVTQIVVKEHDVLDRETLIATLELQQEIRKNETISDTLRENRSTIGIANLVARTAISEREPGTAEPSLSEQIEVLEAMDRRQIDALVEQLLGTGTESQDAFSLMPADYEAGSTRASATMIVVFQTDEIDAATGQAPERIVESQSAMQSLAADRDDESSYVVVGNGILTEEMERANDETFLLLGPLALIFVLVTLSLAYRDVLDVALSLAGTILVLVWTFGAMGWLGITFNPVLIAIPVLLIGLGIDFGIHVFMRYREAAVDGGSAATAMKGALGGVGVALVWVTVTTVIGFLSNLASPVPLIREIGLIAGIGIVGALVVFGIFVPPLKTIVDERVERSGIGRKHSPIGSDGGRTATLLAGGSRLARRIPVVVLLTALLLSAGTTTLATDVNTSFETEETLVEDAPRWSKSLPEPFATSEYSAKESYQAVNERFVHPDSRVEFLVRGSVNDPETLADVAEAERRASKMDTVTVLANGEARTTSPVTVIRKVAAENESFNETVAAADVNGDGIPDENVEAVYDQLHAVAPNEANKVLYRENGEYSALRLSVSVAETADDERTVAQAETLGTVLDGENRRVVATGSPIVNQVVQDSLLESLLVTLAVTLAVITALLAGVYRVAYGSATLGLVTLVPVLMSVSWVFATMYALDVPLNLVTSIVASLAIGLGVDYSIHVSERFRDELDRLGDIDEAISTTVRGTGAALLGSATTTALGFGILAFALVPILQQFGVIMAVMIGYAFVGAVFVLPSLLVLWARHIGTVPEVMPESTG